MQAQKPLDIDKLRNGSGGPEVGSVWAQHHSIHCNWYFGFPL